MRMKTIIATSVILLMLGSMLLMCASAQDDYPDLTWSTSVGEGKTFKWNFQEVTWPDLYYLEEEIVTGSTIEIDVNADMPANGEAYDSYCIGFDEIVELRVNGNTKTFSDFVAGDYSNYIAYLLIPTEASYTYGEVPITMAPKDYLPIVIPLSSGGEVTEEDVVVTSDSTTVYVEVQELDVSHSAQSQKSSGIAQVWQAVDPFDDTSYLTLTIDGYTGEIPEIGAGVATVDDDTTDDDRTDDDEIDWSEFEDWEEEWDADAWEDWDVDWDEWDFDAEDYDMDAWSSGTTDLCYMDMDWDNLTEEFDELEDFDWEEEGLEDLGIYFTLDSNETIDHLHLELEIDLPAGTDPAHIKLFYFDEVNGVWVKIATSSFNPDTGKLEVDIDHLTVFAAAADDSEGSVDKKDAPSGFTVVMLIFGLAGAMLLVGRKRL
jgi:hypothetical protein